MQTKNGTALSIASIASELRAATSSVDAWVDGVTAAVARCVEASHGAVGRVYDEVAGVTRGRYAVHVDDATLAERLREHEARSMQRLDFLVGAGARARSVVATVDAVYDRDAYLRAMVARFRAVGVSDMKHVTVGDGEGLWVTIGVLAGPATATPWTSPSAVAIASHLGAELRRVRTLEGLAARHAAGPGRDALRASLASLARSTGGTESELAEQLWGRLLRGEWMLLDRFRADGRTHLLVRAAPSGWRSPHALTPAEAQVAAHASMGASNKWIADCTEASLSTVSTLLRRAMNALGVTRRAEVTRQFRLGRSLPDANDGSMDRPWLPLLPLPREGLQAVPVDGEAILVSYASGTQRERAGGGAARGLGALPPGRRRVVELALEGLGDESIAERLGVSRHTVSNQLRRAYRDLDVGSRFELVARVSSERDSDAGPSSVDGEGGA